MGYGKEGVVFISVDAGNNALTPKEMFELIEAVDPLSVVLTGAECIQLFAQAYRVNVPNQPAFRVFGREIRSIANMNELMETPEGKQIAWAALKTLPHIGS